MTSSTYHLITKCGRRESNEDVERVKQNLTWDGYKLDNAYGPADIYIVCDGHGGKAVGRFAAPLLEEHLLARNLRYPLTKDYIVKTYNLIQGMIINHPKQIGLECGCTALIVIIYFDADRRRSAQIINIGDSRCVFSKAGLAIPMTLDHKPSWPNEKKRIDQVNAELGTNHRVKFRDGDFRIGDLSVSRAFGDINATPYVTHIPDIETVRIIKSVEFIILACDGVWDVLRNEEVVNFVRDQRDNNHTSFYNIPGFYPPVKSLISNESNIAEKLANYAIARGSGDNVSVIIVFF